MNSTEQKIREAFEKFVALDDDYNFEYAEDAFTAGYRALLNELELDRTEDGFIIYRLPEGVTKP